uniref:Uncharacterized protein n=1 Tax=Propithecus coquereli TaxID=379532 RepID=A0A2K6G3Q6_PROCO
MANSANTNTVPKLYRSVIEDVINDVRDIFLDEGVDEQVLMELKTVMNIQKIFVIISITMNIDRYN